MSIQHENQSQKKLLMGVGALLGALSLMASVLVLQSQQEEAEIRRRLRESQRSLQELVTTTPKVQLPPNVETNLGDIWDPYDRTTSKDTPIFWHILKSGGTSIQAYAMDCLNLVLSNEQGTQFGHDADTVVQVVQFPSERRFINVDTSTPTGIARAKQLGLPASGLADIIVSPLFPEITDMMNSQHRGRVFTMLRHPIERAASMFYYLQIADWEPTYNDQFKSWTIEDYAKSVYAESNWIVRQLVNKRREAIDESDVEVAMEIVRRKMIVGFMNDMAESFRRFETYFGWHAVDIYRQGVLKPAAECTAKYLDKSSGGGANKHSHPPVEPGTEAYRLLSELNWADIALYEKAQTLYQEQASLFRATTST